MFSIILSFLDINLEDNAEVGTRKLVNRCGKKTRAHVFVDVSLASFRILGESNSGDKVLAPQKTKVMHRQV